MDRLDGNPLMEDGAAQMWRDFADRCALVPASGALELPEDTAFNQNAVVDSYRRWTQFVRLVDRYQFVGYEVGSNQKSVLYFGPRDQGDGNAFTGIADAIATTAPARGVTNEWLLMPFYRPYSPHDGNTFDQPTFADYYDLFEPGQWFAPEVYNDPATLWHISYGVGFPSGNYIAESLSGYNYAKLGSTWFGKTYINQKACGGDPTCEAQKLAFYKSRQIYRKPYEIESAESVTRGGKNLVKVTLTTRLQSTLGETDGAPTTVSYDVDGWDGPTVATEPFRTDENALRLYLIREATGYNPPWTVGDQGINSAVHSTVDSVFAAIMPTFLLLRLVPKPAKGASVYHDTFSQLELYIRAMCEGYVDLESTATNTCAADSTGCNDDGYDLVDYTYENLLLQASDGELSGFITLPTTATDTIAEEDCVADPWPSFGPMPATLISAEVFNLFGAALDLLTTARVMLPYALELREEKWDGYQTVPASATCTGGPYPIPCSTPSGYQVSSGTGPPANVFFSDSGWFDGTGWSIEATIGCAYDWFCVGSDYRLSTARKKMSFRFALTDSDALYAIPSDWRDGIAGGNMGTMFCRQYYVKYQTMAGAGSRDCDPGGTIAFGCDIVEHLTPESEQFSCVFRTAGSIDFGEYAPGSVFAVAWNPDYCAIGSEAAEVLTPTAGRTLALQVPLV